MEGTKASCQLDVNRAYVVNCWTGNRSTHQTVCLGSARAGILATKNGIKVHPGCFAVAFDPALPARERRNLPNADVHLMEFNRANSTVRANNITPELDVMKLKEPVTLILDAGCHGCSI